MTRRLLALLLALPILTLPMLGAEAKSEGTMGPHLPHMKGIEKVSQMPFWVSGGMKSVLKDIPGAVVAVEEDALPIMDKLPTRIKVFGSQVRLMKDQAGDPLSVPAPDYRYPGNMPKSFPLFGLTF